MLLGSVRKRLGIGQRIKQIEYKIPILHNRMPPLCQVVYDTYTRHPESKYIVSKLDAEIIYDEIRKHRPNHCVDLGLGLGTVTAIIGMALESNGSGKITSLEHLDWLAQTAKQLLPEPSKKRAEVIRCDWEIRPYFGEKWSCYHFTPSEPDIDYVIVDGPPQVWIDKSGQDQNIPNGDLIRFLPYLKRGCRVFIDGRKVTVRAYHRLLSRWFDIQESRVYPYTLMSLSRVPTNDELKAISC